MNFKTPSFGTSPPPHQGLVLGMLALELGLVTREALCATLQSWLEDTDRAIGVMLVDAGHLAPEDREMLEALVVRHMSDEQKPANEKLRPVREVAALTVGRERPQAPVDVARSLLKTLLDVRSPHGSHNGSLLTELNASNQRFKVLRPHALGGLGLVSIAYDAELNREVAVKEMRLGGPSTEAVQRFMTEARVTGQLDHPGIPPVYALGYFEDGRPFYVMRLIDGVTLKAAIAAFHERYPYPDHSAERLHDLRQLLSAMVSVCNTLSFAHSRNVLHRDIKPSNIMIGEYGETLVLDWGLAKSKEQSEPLSVRDTNVHQPKRRPEDPALTGTGSVMGTPHYMSPEQARGEWESVNFRSDVYSLGATLYTLLTGKLPFSGKTRDEVLDQVQEGALKSPSSIDSRVPAELDAICIKAMAFEREDRFASTAELASEIKHYLADEPVASYNETTTRRWQRWVKARQSLVAAVIALLLTSLIGLSIGLVLVSLERGRALDEGRRANAESARAEKVAKEARDLVASFLVLRYNHHLVHMLGSEKPRLRLLEEAITLLKQWAVEEPQNLRRKLDLAEAIRERARLQVSLNRFDLGWIDMVDALSIMDELQQVPDTSIRGAVGFTRLFLLCEMAELVSESHSRAQTMAFIQYVQYLTQLAYQQSPSILSRLALSRINVIYARQLSDQGRHLEAAELVDGASSQLERMLTDVDAERLENGLFDGRRTVQQHVCEASGLQAQIAMRLGDVEFAQMRAQRALNLCDHILADTPDVQNVVQTRLDMLLLTAALDQTSAAPIQQLKRLRLAMSQAQQAVERYPGNVRLSQLAAYAQSQLAALEMRSGTAEQAMEAARTAVIYLDHFSSEPSWPNVRVHLAHAQCQAAETALALADSPAAQSHCFAARAALEEIDCRADAQDLARVLDDLQFIEQQVEILSSREF